MRHGSKQSRQAARRIPSGGVFDSARNVWKFFVQSGNVNVEGYDSGLVAELRSLLDIPQTKRDLGKDLERFFITTERFIVALFRALQPFAQMMTDLCEFLARHDVRKAGEGLRIRFQFER